MGFTVKPSSPPRFVAELMVGDRDWKITEMGAFSDDDDFAFSSNYGLGCSRDMRLTKHIHDNVHGNIYLDQLFLKFVDTEQFQRLRDLKQLGMVHMVYPGAVHSRFEHSLGVYWLAGEAVHRLKAQQGRELGIDRFDMQTVKLAGLLHDIGHGPFSHLFEREFLPEIVKGSEWSHEQMSVKMVDYIVDEHHIDIDAESMKKVKEMILASSKYATTKRTGDKRFLYDIVANGRNGIDVDKFDYIYRDCRACGLGCNFQFERLMECMRVMGDEICYRAKECKNLNARAELKLLCHLYIFIVTIIKTIETAPDQELKEARDLILRIRRRDIYQFCNEYAVPKDKLENFKKVTAQDIVCSQRNGGTLKEEDLVVSNVRIDLTCGKHNPLDSIKFFQDYDSEESFPIPEDRVSHLLPTSFQDMIVRVYSKKPKLVGVISDAFENFQLKTYGIKAQVCSTPEKKKWHA